MPTGKSESQQQPIGRRRLIRQAASLGLSLSAAQVLAACSVETATAPAPTDPPPTPTPGVAEPYAGYLDPTQGGVWACPRCGEVYPTWQELDLHAAAAHPVPRQPTATAAHATATPPAGGAIRRGTWLCTACNQTLETERDLQAHFAAQHSRRLPAISPMSEPTYARLLLGPIERFDQRNEVFSRAIWDEPYMRQVQGALAERSRAAPQEGAALQAGAIHVDARAGSLHPSYGGYSGHLQGIGGLYSWEEPVNAERYPVSDPAQMSARIKEVARFYGADLVGICTLDARWVYSHYYDRETRAHGELELPYRYAIVMAVEMDWWGIDGSPGFEAGAATALGYSRMAEVAASLARYIRALGYPAVPSGNDSAQSIPLAIDAGLGELGRNGLLITPQLGPRLRLCKVFTDLPLRPDQPIDLGVQSYCERCFMCAHSCPAKAIRSEERTGEPTSISNRTGILRWPVNVERCYLFWQRNGVSCANCVAVCPWALHVRRDWI